MINEDFACQHQEHENNSFNAQSASLSHNSIQLASSATRDEYDASFLVMQSILVNFDSASGTPANNICPPIRCDSVLQDRYGMPFIILTPAQILDQLVYYNAFSESERLIKVPGYGEFLIADFFVHFSQVRRCHLNQFQGFWGEITNIDTLDEWIVFKPECINNGSVRLSTEYFDTISSQYGIIDNKSTKRVTMLVFGSIEDSEYGMHINISEPSHCALKLYRK